MGDIAWHAARAWPTSCEKFTAVQNILDRNKLLINEINANHDSRSPEGLEHNVVLIRELNSNIQKVVELYKELSAVFVQTLSDQSQTLRPGLQVHANMEHPSNHSAVHVGVGI
mmetsp:Transcript_35397/g.67714  ORF Transcript_35397/g.67714 Transcript_35397/m.67714 type:complete len:113 (-) Transcript_35397:195-533(-)